MYGILSSSLHTFLIRTKQKLVQNNAQLPIPIHQNQSCYYIPNQKGYFDAQKWYRDTFLTHLTFKFNTKNNSYPFWYSFCPLRYSSSIYFTLSPSFLDRNEGHNQRATCFIFFATWWNFTAFWKDSHIWYAIVHSIQPRNKRNARHFGANNEHQQIK